MGLLVPRAPRGFPSIPAEPPPRQAQQEPAHSSFTSAGASRGAFSCEDTGPSPGQRQGLRLRAGPRLREGPSLCGPWTLAFFFLYKGPGARLGSAGEHFIAFHGKPCGAPAGLAVSTRPFRFSRLNVSKPHQQAAAWDGPASQGPLSQRVSIFLSFFLLKVCFQREGRLGRSDTGAWVGGFQFPSEHSSPRPRPRPRAHSSRLFVDFWAHVFSGH